MKELTSKAINKVEKDGVASLFISGPPYLFKITKRELQIRLNSDVNEPRKKIYVNPKDIEYYRPSLFSGSYRNHFGKIKEGEWDKERYPIEEHHKYKACKQRAEGKSWEETGIIDHMVGRLENSDKDAIEHGCESRKDFLRLYNNKRENLFQSMKSNGFNEELSDVCCRVHISRDGELILASGGRHRLFFAKILEIKEIPVRVLWRHQQWQSIREEIKSANKYSDLSERARKHSGHPDLQNLCSTIGPKRN